MSSSEIYLFEAMRNVRRPTYVHVCEGFGQVLVARLWLGVGRQVVAKNVATGIATQGHGFGS